MRVLFTILILLGAQNINAQFKNVLLKTDSILGKQQLATIADTTLAKDSIFNTINKLTTNNSLDTINSYYKFFTKNPIPKRAGMFSALLPGLGQIYNKQYWKLPIVYGGLAFGTYFIIQGRQTYNSYQQAIINRLDNNPNTNDSYPYYSINNLKSLSQNVRTIVDKYSVYVSVFYGVTVLDALVSAHLRTFDISKNLSFKPTLIQQTPGLAAYIKIN